MESAFNVQPTTFSMQMEFVVKWNLNVKISTDKSEFVKPAMKDMKSSMLNALELTWSTQLERVVRLGPTENVLNVQADGTSMPAESANQSATNAEPGLQVEFANHVIQAMLLLMDTVLKIQTHSDQPQMTSVLSGRIESVLHVLTEPISMPTESADKFQLNVPLGTLLTESV